MLTPEEQDELHRLVQAHIPTLYLRRQGASLRLTIEHRAAPGLDGLVLELRVCGDALALHLVDAGPVAADHDPAPAVSHLDHIEHVLASLSAPIPRRELRRACRIRDSALSDALGQLLTAGRVVKSPAGYHLAPR